MTPPNLKQSARAAGLCYVKDCQPGLSRQRWGRGFSYFDCKGNRITDSAERDRLKALKIPPAWTDVWICPHSHGHLIATGRDAKGRKQYLYHPEWQQIRSQSKYDRMMAFGNMLPILRTQIVQDIQRPGLSRPKVLATVVKLLEKTLIRVGNENYVRENQSFGLTTMRDRHLSLIGDRIEFHFSGKSGVEHEIALNNAQLARILKRCQELPGQELFQYKDHGVLRSVESGDVNNYLQQIMGDRFSAKDFRTWFGTVRALESLIEQELEATTESTEVENLAKIREVRIRTAIEQTAAHLGNRPATCKKYYIHPILFEIYQNGQLISHFNLKRYAYPTLQELETFILDRLEPDILQSA